VAELFGNSRSQQLAAGRPSDVLARCWILASAERDRSLNLLGNGAAFHVGAAFPRAREGGASASGFDPAAPARSYGDCSARADRNRWPRGGPFVSIFNLTQQPAVSIPVGLTASGLPIGLQVVGRRFEDALVLRAANAIRNRWHLPRRPTLVATERPSEAGTPAPQKLSGKA
jgi:Amidase